MESNLSSADPEKVFKSEISTELPPPREDKSTECVSDTVCNSKVDPDKELD
jgi:hypothetical protein